MWEHGEGFPKDTIQKKYKRLKYWKFTMINPNVDNKLLKIKTLKITFFSHEKKMKAVNKNASKKSSNTKKTKKTTKK